MDKSEERRREERKKRERERERLRQFLEQKQRRKYRSLHDKHKRRRRDCTLGMPFIIAFQGDPSQLYYCNDIPKYFELIPRTEKYPDHEHPFSRLKRYMRHHIVNIAKKVLVYKAA